MKKLLLIILFPLSLFAQGVYVPAKTVFGTVNGFTRPVAGATITVCAANTGGTPCSPALANTVFQDIALQVPLSNPLFADSNGNYPQFAVAPGTYTITESAAGYSGFSYQFQSSCVAGGPCIVGTLTAGSIVSTGPFSSASLNGPIGTVAPNTGAFTTLNVSGISTLAAVNAAATTATSVTTGQIIQPAATALTIKDNQGGTRFSIPSGGVTQATLNNTQVTGGSTLGGTMPYNRLRANQGTALVTGDVGSLTNFGTTASVAAVSGTDSAGTISILSNGTGQVANGQFILTFHDGTWTTAPVCIANRAEGTGPNSAPVATASNATTISFIFNGTAAAGVTYTFNFICIGRP